jgi:hypothetical protein
MIRIDDDDCIVTWALKYHSNLFVLFALRLFGWSQCLRLVFLHCCDDVCNKDDIRKYGSETTGE